MNIATDKSKIVEEFIKVIDVGPNVCFIGIEIKPDNVVIETRQSFITEDKLSEIVETVKKFKLIQIEESKSF